MMAAVPVFLSLEGQCAAQGHPPRVRRLWVAARGPATSRLRCWCGHVDYTSQETHWRAP